MLLEFLVYPRLNLLKKSLKKAVDQITLTKVIETEEMKFNRSERNLLHSALKSLLPLALAAGYSFSGIVNANAADLGGDCCADLEERVAVLEATTARKGNRKILFQISGWVNKAILIWNDGTDSDAYVLDSTYGSTRFRFTGGAKINSNWSAGYKIELEPLTDRTFSINQANDDNASFVRIRTSHMYLKSNFLGKLTWGLGSQPTNNFTFSSNYGGLAVLVAGGQADFLGNSSFTLGAIGPRVFDISGSLQSASFFESSFLTSIIRYDSPVLAGFQLSASWGEDDLWDVTLRTTQNWGDIGFKAGVGYREFYGDDLNATARGITKEANLLINAGIIHKPTGMYLHGEYSGYEFDASVAGNEIDNAYGWHVQAGIKQNWNSLGETTLWGGYTEINNGYQRISAATLAPGIDTELSKVAFGIIQDIDAVAMHLYATYEYQEIDISGSAPINDIDFVLVGSIIKF